MGCRYCTSGLGRNCHGPLGIDDLEVGCDCDCHKCDTCGSAHCENVGGDDPCEDYDATDDWYEDEEVTPPAAPGEKGET